MTFLRKIIVFHAWILIFFRTFTLSPLRRIVLNFKVSELFLLVW